MAIITEIRRKLPLLPRRDPDQTTTSQSTIHNIRVDDIIPNRNQPRSAFNQNAIVRLSDSIKRYGILQPLTVRKVFLPGTVASSNTSPTEPVLYELVAGERRLRAAKLAELTTVPCIIINTDDATSAELAIIENLLRENLNMFEQAEAFQRLIKEFHLTQDEAARRVSMSQSAVANKLRILRLLPEEREKILTAGLTERHARALLKLTDPALRGDVLQQILDRKMNVSATETYIDNILTEMARFHAKDERKAVEKQPPAQQSYTADYVGEPQSDIASVESAAINLVDLSDDVDPFDDATLPSAIRTVMAHRRTRFKGCIKDLQLFYNSVRNAVHILESVGILGEITKIENENEVKVVVTLTRAPVER